MKPIRRSFLPTSFSLLLSACLAFFACSEGTSTSGGGGGGVTTRRCRDVYIVGEVHGEGLPPAGGSDG